MSKGVSERIGCKFGGIYGGGASTEEVKKVVENADLVWFLGRYPVSDPLNNMPFMELMIMTRATSIRMRCSRLLTTRQLS